MLAAAKTQNDGNQLIFIPPRQSLFYVNSNTASTDTRLLQVYRVLAELIWPGLFSRRALLYVSPDNAGTNTHITPEFPTKSAL